MFFSINMKNQRVTTWRKIHNDRTSCNDFFVLIYLNVIHLIYDKNLEKKGETMILFSLFIYLSFQYKHDIIS